MARGPGTRAYDIWHEGLARGPMIYGTRAYSAPARSAVGLRGRRVMIKLRVVVPLGPTTRRRLRAQPFCVVTWNPQPTQGTTAAALPLSVARRASRGEAGTPTAWPAGRRAAPPEHPRPGCCAVRVQDLPFVRNLRLNPSRSTHCHWRPGCCSVRDIPFVMESEAQPVWDTHCHGRPGIAQRDRDTHCLAGRATRGTHRSTHCLAGRAAARCGSRCRVNLCVGLLSVIPRARGSPCACARWQ